MLKEFFKRRKIKKEMNDILDGWRYEHDKKLYVYDGKELVEEITFKEFVDRRIEEATCECRRRRGFWENMLSSSQVYPLKKCSDCSTRIN